MKHLNAYLDAVTDALMAAGVDVRDNGADANEPLIGIDLAPSGAVTPVALWTPDAGWRVATAERGEVQLDTVRYVHAGPVPSPTYVAESVRRWLNRPNALSDVAPAYEVSPESLALRLADPVGPVELPRPLSHVLIDGSGCPGFCTGHEPTPGVRTTLVHKGRTMRVGGVDVYPAVLVDTAAPPSVPFTSPRMRVIVTGGDGLHLPLGIENGQRLAKLLTLAGDETGLASVLRAALTTLEIEQRDADQVAAERREQMEAATR